MSDIRGHVSTVKSLSTKHFSIELVELPSSNYCVLYEVNGQVAQTETMLDLNNALIVYDDILVKLEGN